ncbi:DUF1704 domain-containing protein [Roseiconus nitratireducens]|uniref:DUF1704 domain-containing protein n=1 Tax=Roseiconus nitratireducens TaxID=2605748 RepID=A0A5M6D0L9_9BACT|nr:tyrosine/phenylalanine carboxypeptidase domain-containing protein [Roseiconus nitratireducens]KAA5538705.1 DUF1704 domain-containing protein [Roseiconus nitratireducens]
MTPEFKQRLVELDSELIRLAKPINVLKYLNWPDSVEHVFLEGWRAGRPSLPDIEISVPDWTDTIEGIDDYVSRCDGDDVLLQYLRRTAFSYGEAARMLMAAGTPEFTERSIHLYGRPDDVYATQSFSGIDAATFLLQKTDHLMRASHITPAQADLPAALFAERLQKAVDDYFVDDQIRIVVDDQLSSKAIAGTTRIRIRGSALFSQLDFDQLYQHEALVHTATAINGRRQVNLKVLSLGAPRTTRTQEGIAVFAELVTRSIDINRLRRLALRIKALQRVLEGADFIECFKLFLDGGQVEREAYKSTQRIFRGGDVRGRIAFTKDSAYLKGLMEAHVLMNVAIRDNQPQILNRLFAGRLAMSDTITLAPYFENGFIDPPRYVPPWARDTDRLAASLAYSSFMMNVDLAPVTLQRFVEAANRTEGGCTTIQ